MLTEITCVIFVLDYGFMGIFLFSDEDSQSVIENPHYVKYSAIEEEGKIEDALVMIRENPFVKEDEIEIVGKFYENKDRLGVLYRANFNGKEALYRKISLSRVSKYVVEEFSAEIDSYKRFNSQKIVPIYGIILQLPTVGILSAYYPTTLFRVLHEDNETLPILTVISIAKNIASCLQEIHFQGKAHGHLTSHNIMLTNNHSPAIADLGFTKIKKYAGIMFGYSVKSGWSSPEILKEKRLMPTKFTESDDIFSFGTILWEMVACQEPFQGYTLKMLEQKVVVEGLRPKIPEDLPMEIENLIVSCWNSDSNTRPSMGLIVQSLDSIRMSR